MTQQFINMQNDISAVLAAGGSTTSEYERISQRWNDYLTLETDARSLLVDAILGSETPERIAELHALALSEALRTPVTQATVINTAEIAMFPVLRNEYAKTAAANYETIRNTFNATAAKFKAAAATVNPEASAESLISTDDKTRTAWVNIAVTAQQLNRMIPALAAAARLAGARVTTNADHLSLTTNPGTLHRRRVWEAWETTEGRTERWGAMTKLGATIHAPALDSIKPYREPAPMEIKQKHNGQGIVQFQHDPEDDEYNRLNKAKA
ncbi:hypothetical protein ACQCSX_08765 [Pseudarthrobacter sp. P1]|uniref:hypothetical protein n=1 Tax=Pseudarthrobacter sp. P1 TaxID=3418418 RepID=UPI003CF64CB6